MPRHFSLREFVLMCLPLLLVVVAARWAQQRPHMVPQPSSAPQPLQLRVVEFKKLPPTAYDVSRGADTKVRIKVKSEGILPGGVNGWDWFNDVYVVALKNGRERRIVDLDGDSEEAWRRRVLRGGGGEGRHISTNHHGDFQMEMGLRLQDIPPEAGALELRWDWALGPNIFPGNDESGAAAMARHKRSGKVLTTTATLPLRRDGEQVERVDASTDPLFDVREVEFRPSPQADAGDLQIVLHIFYRGPVSNDNQHMSANVKYELDSESGYSYTTGTGGMAASRSPGGLRRYELDVIIDTTRARSTHPHIKKLIWRANISINNAWPRQVSVPITLPPEFHIPQSAQQIGVRD